MPRDRAGQERIRQQVFGEQLTAWIARRHLDHMNLDDQWEEFRTKALANGYQYQDWYAAFQGWLTSPYQKSNGTPPEQRRLAQIEKIYAEEDAHESQREHRHLH